MNVKKWSFFVRYLINKFSDNFFLPVRHAQKKIKSINEANCQNSLPCGHMLTFQINFQIPTNHKTNEADKSLKLKNNFESLMNSDQ